MLFPSLGTQSAFNNEICLDIFDWSDEYLALLRTKAGSVQCPPSLTYRLGDTSDITQVNLDLKTGSQFSQYKDSPLYGFDHKIFDM